MAEWGVGLVPGNWAPYDDREASRPTLQNLFGTLLKVNHKDIAVNGAI